MTAGTPLLEVEDLTVSIGSGAETVYALGGVSLTIRPGEIVGVVGETGAGKSLTAWAALGLLPPAADVTAGHVRFAGVDTLTASEPELRAIRGKRVGIVVQHPLAALNPMVPVGRQLALAYQAHVDCSRQEAEERAIEGLRQVRIPDPERRAQAHPHELSGGMAQRVLIAMALLHAPELLIADEPTSSLDVTIQAEVMDLMLELVTRRNTALLLITHDLAIVASHCERIAIMFHGQIVESGPVDRVFEAPRHPYTRGLIGSGLDVPRDKRFRIAGAPPDLTHEPEGCRFAYRCPLVHDRCHREPPDVQVGDDHVARCWLLTDEHGAERHAEVVG